MALLASKQYSVGFDEDRFDQVISAALEVAELPASTPGGALPRCGTEAAAAAAGVAASLRGAARAGASPDARRGLACAAGFDLISPRQHSRGSRRRPCSERRFGGHLAHSGECGGSGVAAASASGELDAQATRSCLRDLLTRVSTLEAARVGCSPARLESQLQELSSTQAATEDRLAELDGEVGDLARATSSIRRGLEERNYRDQRIASTLAGLQVQATMGDATATELAREVVSTAQRMEALRDAMEEDATSREGLKRRLEALEVNDEAAREAQARGLRATKARLLQLGERLAVQRDCVRTSLLDTCESIGESENGLEEDGWRFEEDEVWDDADAYGRTGALEENRFTFECQAGHHSQDEETVKAEEEEPEVVGRDCRGAVMRCLQDPSDLIPYSV